MEENKVINEEKEVMEEIFDNLEETEIIEVKKNKITSFSNRKRNTNVTCETITNINDVKLLYNLSTSVDLKLNDCVGEKIRIKGIVIKIYEKPLKEPIIDEETGELKEFERKISTVLVDDTGKSYATGSKSFAYQLLNFIDGGYVTEQEINEKGLDIEIMKKNIQNSNNKALGFKIL